MPAYRLSDITWKEVRVADPVHAMAILPDGAVEAHVPHAGVLTIAGREEARL